MAMALQAAAAAVVPLVLAVPVRSEAALHTGHRTICGRFSIYYLLFAGTLVSTGQAA
jgi:hypothetical protein